MSDYPVITARIAEYGVDLDGQRMDPQWLDREIGEWQSRGGLVTAMFQGAPVAVAESVEHDDRGWTATVRALNQEAAENIRSGLYKGLGVSIKFVHVTLDGTAPNGVIDAGRIVTVSLVDRPMTYGDE